MLGAIAFFNAVDLGRLPPVIIAMFFARLDSASFRSCRVGRSEDNNILSDRTSELIAMQMKINSHNSPIFNNDSNK